MRPAMDLEVLAELLARTAVRVARADALEAETVALVEALEDVALTEHRRAAIARRAVFTPVALHDERPERRLLLCAGRDASGLVRRPDANRAGIAPARSARDAVGHGDVRRRIRPATAGAAREERKGHEDACARLHAPRVSKLGAIPGVAHKSRFRDPDRLIAMSGPANEGGDAAELVASGNELVVPKGPPPANAGSVTETTFASERGSGDRKDLRQRTRVRRPVRLSPANAGSVTGRTFASERGFGDRSTCASGAPAQGARSPKGPSSANAGSVTESPTGLPRQRRASARRSVTERTFDCDGRVRALDQPSSVFASASYGSSEI